MKITEIESKVYGLVKKIPAGRVSTYKSIAEALRLKSPRLAAMALRRNKKTFFSPVCRRQLVACHRVVKSSGDVGGYSRGRGKKISLLDKEGVRTENGKIKNLKRYFFNFRNKC